MEDIRPSRMQRIIENVQRNPLPVLAFILGAFLPLVIAGLYWAQVSGGLAGPLVDTRPPAFIVPTD